ncbi:MULTISPECIES: hypothetical protein [Mesorhizobium]|uniref:hypothetical protein n=1 Tax=Mesorhizobium sp. TaxID=1871066 RepID=UPI00338F4AB8
MREASGSAGQPSCTMVRVTTSSGGSLMTPSKIMNSTMRALSPRPVHSAPGVPDAV